MERIKKLERINNVVTWVMFLFILLTVTTDNIVITLIAIGLVIAHGIIDVEIVQALKRELMKREVRLYFPNDRGTH